MTDKVPTSAMGFFQTPPEHEGLTLKVEQILPTALSLLKENKISVKDVSSITIADEHNSWTSCTIGIKKTIDKITDLNVMLVERLIDLPDELLKKVVIKFIRQDN